MEAEETGSITAEYSYFDGEPLTMWRAETPPGTIAPIAPLGDITTPYLTFEWSDLPNVTDYRLHVYDRELLDWTFDVTYLASDICSAGTCSVVPTGLSVNAGVSHFWGVRANNSAGWGDLVG